MLDISELSPIADYFVIAGATSARQVRALLEAARDVDTLSARPARVEGEPESGWVLIDHGSVVTHLFSAEKRAFFRLEEVWRAARVVVRLQ
jgi:ribosome-associated protein